MSRRRLHFEWDSMGPEDDDDLVRIMRHHFSGLCGPDKNPLISTSVPADVTLELFDRADQALIDATLDLHRRVHGE